MSNSKKDKKFGKVPEGYFDRFDEKLMKRINEDVEGISKEAPILFKLGKDHGYKIPANYLEEFKVVLPRTKVISFSNWAKGIAASLAIVLAAVIFMPSINQTEEDFLAAVEDDELYDYIISNAEDFGDDDLLPLAGNENFLGNTEQDLDFEYLMDNLSDFDLNDLQEL